MWLEVLLCLVVLALAVFYQQIIALASAIHGLERNRWRQCLGCGRYFNDRGVIKEPHFTMNIGHPGVCPECSRDVHYRQ